MGERCIANECLGTTGFSYCKSVKHRLHPKRSEEVKGRVEICEANTTRP